MEQYIYIYTYYGLQYMIYDIYLCDMWYMRRGMTLYDMIWCDMIWYDMMWYDMYIHIYVCVLLLVFVKYMCIYIYTYIYIYVNIHMIALHVLLMNYFFWVSPGHIMFYNNTLHFILP